MITNKAGSLPGAAPRPGGLRGRVEVPAGAGPGGGGGAQQGPGQQADRQGGRRRDPVAGGDQPPLPRDARPPPAPHRHTRGHVGSQEGGRAPRHCLKHAEAAAGCTIGQ